MSNPDGIELAVPGQCDDMNGLQNAHGVDLDTNFYGKLMHVISS